MTGRLRPSADGWRGIIGTDFTAARAAALAASAVEVAGGAPVVLVGYDCRAGGAEAAAAVAAAALAAGARAVRLVRHLPTPTATAAVRIGRAQLALLVTASHNPARWNGIKLKVAPGCPPRRELESAIDARFAARQPIRYPVDGPGLVPAEPFDPLWTDHVEDVLARLPVPEPAGLAVVVDGLGGVAGEPFVRFGERLGWRAHRIGCVPRHDFGGMVPDPSLPASRVRAAHRVVAEAADLGVVLDGDGDRVYVLDHRGATAHPHELLALLVEHRHRRGWHIPGTGVAVTAATGNAVRLVARQLGLAVHEVGIGFKHLSPLLAAGDADAAGGGVGDFGFVEFGLDRDPYAVAVLLADLLARSGRPLAELLADLRIRTGDLTWFETRVPGTARLDLATVGRRALDATGLTGALTGVSAVDGVKFWLEGGQWLLLRASTTGAGVRVYGETRGERSAAALVAAVATASGSSGQSDREERACRNRA